MTWSNWNWINVFCVFFSGYLALTCWSDGREKAGHFNAFACVLNAVIVATRLGL
jgi:hypothetical protein